MLKICPTGAALATISDSFHGSARIAVPHVVYSDSAGHLLSSLTWGFDGRQIVACTATTASAATTRPARS